MKKDIRELVKLVIQENESKTNYDITKDMVIVDQINKSTIDGDFPKDAQYCVYGKSGEFITKFYKIQEVKNSGDTNSNRLHYWSERGGWYPSAYNLGQPDHNKLKRVKFIKIV